MAQPDLHTGTDDKSQDKPLPLVEKEVAKTDTEPKATASYGDLLADTGQVKQGQKKNKA